MLGQVLFPVKCIWLSPWTPLLYDSEERPYHWEGAGRSPLHLVHICIIWHTVNSGVCPGQTSLRLGSVYLLATSARCLLHTGVQETLKDPWVNVE